MSLLTCQLFVITAASENGTRTRNKRKGKPQKLGSLPKTKITAGDKKCCKAAARSNEGSSKKTSKRGSEAFPCEVCGVVFNRQRRFVGDHGYKFQRSIISNIWYFMRYLLMDHYVV